MKVAILSPTIDVTNGWGNYTYEYCSHLKGIVDFTLYLPEEEQRKHDEFDFPVKYILPPFFDPFKEKFGEKKSHFRYLEPLELGNVDLIHSIASFPYAILAYHTAKERKIPYIVGIHGGYGVFPLEKRAERKHIIEAYLHADFLFAVSSFLANIIRRRIKREVKVLPNAVNYERFQKNYNLEELKKKYSPGPTILTVSRIQARKGQDIGLKSFKIVKKYFPNSKFILVGKNLWKNYVPRLIEKLKLRDVYLVGEKRGKELVKYYQFCDVFVHVPRLIRKKIEGFGIVYLEAGACGKPVIGSKSGGVPDAVIDGVTGILVPENNPKATSYAILKLLKDRQLGKKLGENGKERAKELNWGNYVKKLMNIYSDCLMGKSKIRKF